MRIQLPLYGKILAWFFLNLVAVVAVLLALFNAQFHFNLDWLLATGARERLESVRDLIVGELETTPPDDWVRVMERYSEAQHVRFALFDDNGGALVGGFSELPAEVHKRIVERPPFGRFRRPEDRNAPPPPPSPNTTVATPPPGPEFPTPSPGRRGWPRPQLRALMRTVNPTCYWLLASARLDNPMVGEPMRVVLVVRSDTVSAGGLILDPKPWIAVGIGVVVFSLCFWLPLIRGITRTIGKMMMATRQIADGRFDVRIGHKRNDELGALSESIDQMAVRLDGLVTGQKRFLGDIAHELCSPLARLQMALGILEQRASGDQAEFVKSATEKAEQISALVGELLSFSKASFGASAVAIRPVQVLDAVKQAIQREVTNNADVQVDVPSDLQVAADVDLLVRALGNLIRNAIRHGSPDGPIFIKAHASSETDVTITVADCGPGVPEAELSKIFDAFYRLDASRARETGGVGLGLAIVRTCVESCGGTVSARNGEPSGLKVSIILPAATAVLKTREQE
jgi:two-component system sensor histidine kinase CpxA